MKIAIISDLHLGFGSGTERGEESFENARQAFELAAKHKADAIVIAGDLFDDAVPSQETWEKAFGVFPPMGDGGVAVNVSGKNGGERNFSVSMPVIAIHGTHEFRTKDYTNALEVLESAGVIIYIHAATAVIGKGGKGKGEPGAGNELFAVHGLGGVPEKKALDALNAWNPKPKPGMRNIVMMHQSIKEFLPVDDEMVATISCDDLPKGFDLVVNGHLHWHSEKQLHNVRLLIAGSTIITQMKKLEGEIPKGISIYDTSSGSIEFLHLPVQRRLFYHSLEFREAKPDAVLAEARAAVRGDITQKQQLAPLIRLKLTGSLAKGVSQSDVSLAEIESEFHGKAVFSATKDFFTEPFKSKIAELREKHNSRRSVASMGFDMLEKSLGETDFADAFDARRVFELLADDKTQEVVELLSKKKEGKG